MPNWKLTISYFGKDFYGFQKQKDKRTVQGVLENILKDIFQEDIRIIGAGRTDRGVHAINQVVNFKTEKDFHIEKLKYVLNSLLPRDITLKDLEIVGDDFHARYSAKNKTYMYIIYNSKNISPFLWDFTWQISKSLNVDLLMRSAELILGEHDFINFCSLDEKKNTIIKIESAYWEKKGEFLFFFITASHFLRKMVRFLVGGMVEVGLEKKDIEEWKLYLEKKFDKRFGKCAPSEGLYLLNVKY
ncbi:MAG: tRNA pseudouridine(38-40) synthase TruA [Dictyoglomus sp. NZ13-RE01]|nr:MAG: tRNA pseudouridine(38-40) synthase TruA [Dictyoglomus sp. NZ13-RE01]